MSIEKYDYILKTIIVGDGAVGKTALSVRFIEGKFKTDYKMTIGVDFSIKLMKVDDKSVKFQIWDTGGQEQFSYVRPLYYKGSVGGLVVFDKTNRQSFYNVGKWFKEVYENAGGIPLILVGNKIDLSDHQVTTDEAHNLAQQYNTIYYETSAKSGESVDTVFDALVRMIIDPKYVERLNQAGVEYEKSQIYYNEAYQQYDNYSNQATAYFQAGNMKGTLTFLKEALYWAKKADFQDGINWCEAQIAYVSEMVNKQELTPVEGIVLTCPSCNTYFKVNSNGYYTCPKCSSTLVNISSNEIKV